MITTNFKKLNSNVICEEVKPFYQITCKHTELGFEQVYGVYQTLEQAQAMLEMQKDNFDSMYEYFIEPIQ